MKTPVTLTGYVVVALLEAGMSSQVCLQSYLLALTCFPHQLPLTFVDVENMVLFQRKQSLNNVSVEPATSIF